MAKLKKVKVAGFDYNIVEANVKSLHGEADYRDLILAVDTRLPKHRMLHTFLHELIHAIDEAYVMPENNDEEIRADIYAQAFLQIFRDNKQLLDFIKENI